MNGGAARKRNAPWQLKLPGKTFEMGKALDLFVEPDDSNEGDRVWRFEDEEWIVLSVPGAFAMRAGHAPIYVVKVELAPEAVAPTNAVAVSDYEKWHKRAPDQLLEVDGVPARATHYCGIGISIGYRSDKWNERHDLIDYDHDFFEGRHVPPLVYADCAEPRDVRLFAIFGGDMRVTERGID